MNLERRKNTRNKETFREKFTINLSSMWKKIIRLFISLTADEQEKEYLKNNGYPKQTVVFADRTGRLTQIIGSDVINKAYDELKSAGLNI